VRARGHEDYVPATSVASVSAASSLVAAYSYAWQFTGYQIAAAPGFRALAVNYTSGSGVDTLGIQRGPLWPIIAQASASKPPT